MPWGCENAKLHSLAEWIVGVGLAGYRPATAFGPSGATFRTESHSAFRANAGLARRHSHGAAHAAAKSATAPETATAEHAGHAHARLVPDRRRRRRNAAIAQQPPYFFLNVGAVPHDDAVGKHSEQHALAVG